MGAAHPRSPNALARAQWLSEQVLDWAGFVTVHLRGAFFFENILLFSEETIVQTGLIENAFGDAAMPWLAGEDMARAATSLLTQVPEKWPAPEGTNRVLWLANGETYNFTQIARVFSGVLERPVRYGPLSAEAWKSRLLENPRVSVEMAAHITALAQRIRTAGASMPFDPETTRQLIDREPTTLEEFLRSSKVAQCFSSGPRER